MQAAQQELLRERRAQLGGVPDRTQDILVMQVGSMAASRIGQSTAAAAPSHWQLAAAAAPAVVCEMRRRAVTCGGQQSSLHPTTAPCPLLVCRWGRWPTLPWWTRSRAAGRAGAPPSHTSRKAAAHIKFMTPCSPCCLRPAGSAPCMPAACSAPFCHLLTPLPTLPALPCLQHVG